MLEVDRIQTLQYMGSKSRMLNNICKPIIEDKDIETVVDLFAGTGSVGYALAPYKHIVSNDLEYYAYVVNEAILNGCNIDDENMDLFREAVKRKYSVSSSYVNYAILKEKEYLEGDLDHYAEYAAFSEGTPSIFNPKTDISELKSIEKLVACIAPGKKEQNVQFPCLFLTYFASAYFGINQCCQIDAIASQILEIEEKRIRNVFFAALMTALSICASTTTHFAQYLKVKSKGTFRNIREKRSQDIFSLFDDALKKFEEKGLMRKTAASHECHNVDFLDCLKEIKPDTKTLVYADPPYFKEHYSRYYHVLNTLCLYDYPAPAVNPQTKVYSIGRYRTERSVSDFGKRAKVLEAFRRMINVCADKQLKLVISYSENSLVKIYELLKLAEERYRVKVDKVILKHSSQGRATETDQSVKEFIFFCDQPDGSEVKIKGFSNELGNIKPVVDNPAGFIHNYMARKPYNVVSKIINSFTGENDVVFDPMFGSGTTLIEASKLGRRAIGCDINPIAYKLCKVSLEDWDIEKVNCIVDQFVSSVDAKCKGIYRFEENGQIRIIERCHFDLVDGKLIPVGYWFKEEKKGKLSGRKKGEVSNRFCEIYDSYANSELDTLSNKSLIPNSRIAIKENATVFDYFCNRNLIVLDKIFSILNMFKECYGYEVLEVLVSSSINLIKLSDKKASSQMPYWLPQKNVTSRNACFILKQKAEAIKEGLLYLKSECKKKVDDGIQIYNMPAQDIGEMVMKNVVIALL